MAKDYYLILGVPLDAAPDEIRSAFRKLALRYHPDRRSGAGAGPFRSISEAYDVLSDPARRARYDRELRGRGQEVAVAADISAVRDPEPLVSEPVPIAGRPESVSPSYEALLDRLGRSVFHPEAPKAAHEEPLNFELVLSPEEVRRGILVPFQVPVFWICRQCGGLGRHWVFPCEECDGEGRFIDRETVDVRVPAGVRDGTLIDVSLEALGIRNLWLRGACARRKTLASGHAFGC